MANARTTTCYVDTKTLYWKSNGQLSPQLSLVLLTKLLPSGTQILVPLLNISSNFKLICTYSGTRIRKLTEHTGVINSCDVSREDSNIIASASDDCTGYHKYLIFENWNSNYWWYSLQWFYGMQGCIESLFAACIMTIKFAVFASPLMVNISSVEESTT